MSADQLPPIPPQPRAVGALEDVAPADLVPALPDSGLSIQNVPPLNSDEEIINLNEELAEDKKYNAFLPQIVKAAHRFGYIRYGWNLYDYLYAAIKGDPNISQSKGGWEDVAIWGKQGGGKSNLSMQLMFILYQDWDWVLKRMILTAPEVLNLYHETQQNQGRVPIIALDDITTVFPKQLWFVSKEMFITLQQFIATIRMRFANILSSTPLPQNLISSIKENVTFEVITYPQSSYMVERYAWLTDLQKPCVANLKKIYVEYSSFDIYEVPGDVWKQYEDQRWEVTKTIVSRMEETLKALDAAMGGKESDDEVAAAPDPERYIHVSLVMREQDWTPTKAMRELKKGYLRNVKYQGTYYVLREDYELLMRRQLMARSGDVARRVA